ncbi:hypothetical protein P3551_21140 [Vibrio parahaemolyticus]|nr:hypothetical protein [Vibrio parahaemolyticus]MDF4901788.1 hypothetical protein [Vibrio parahaemolyticus]HCG7330464.1 hypothetical protein [Vibrio parahaemolyticus]HCG8859920.1 hypothetical protein [Vibrio parahaemolyticus]HCG9589043.1 hypothetical protein [Vibrio parahaemolyticus]
MRNNSRFAKDQSHSYVVVDFDNVTENGLKKLINALKSAGVVVTDVEAPNRKIRKDGEQVKKAKFFFENGQSMTLFIGDSGDIFQMTLNATKQPIPSVKNERELAKEMARLMERNQSKFDKAIARKAANAVKDTSATKPASRSIAKRLEEANEAVATASGNHLNALGARDAAKTSLENKQRELSELEKKLKAELVETKELEQQVEALS